MLKTQDKPSTFLDRPLLSSITINWETVIFVLIILLAFVTRFYDLESRVMSHDENTHVYFSWLFSRGQDYAHDPLSHGPFQFHVVALSYLIFGDNDFTARIPAALASIAAILFIWNYRRYLGKAGALIAAGLFLISPYMLYYGRYVRNEAYVALFGVITLWAILRYLETGKHRYLYYLTTVTVLHFATKETAFIYTAQALIFLGFYFLYRIAQQTWKSLFGRNLFFALLIIAALFAGAGGGRIYLEGRAESADSQGFIEPIPLDSESEESESALNLNTILIVGGLIAFAAAFITLLRGYGWEALCNVRSFSLMILLLTLVLPHLSPFVIQVGNKVFSALVTMMTNSSAADPNNPNAILKFFQYFQNVNVLEYRTAAGAGKLLIYLIPLFAISALIGLKWKPRVWLINNAIFYSIFVVLFTSIFTNGFGFFSGMVGSLGYWLAQQAVERGSQPWYYYIAVQVPIYEYLPALGVLFAALLGIRAWGKSVYFRIISALASRLSPEEEEEPLPEISSILEANEPEEEAEEPAEQPDISGPQPAPTAALLGFWVVTSAIAYAVAGEKMPWLTVHITLPMLLLTGWYLGKMIDAINWQSFREMNGGIVLLLLPIFIASLFASIGILLSPTPPFMGSELAQLEATSGFLVALTAAALSGGLLAWLLKTWPWPQITNTIALSFFALLGLLTTRTAFMATYINYDDANEFLVYAHSAGGVKEILAQIEEISMRTTGGLDIVVAYDDISTYPYWWYLRNYDNKIFYGGNPTGNIRDAAVILVGDVNFGKLEPLVNNNYYRFDYIRLWWPNQDYYGLTYERIKDAAQSAEMRAALWDIWFYRDYERYATVKGYDYKSSSFNLPNWNPSSRMRMYVRRDVVAMLWDHGLSLVQEPIKPPDEGKYVDLTADSYFGVLGSEPGQFQHPRGIAAAPDGSLYVADTDNHRIQHLSPDGAVLESWGTFYHSSEGDEAPPGTFDQPWDVAVDPNDGTVYVADTWNHRIQKFSPTGEFITMWGSPDFGQTTNFYGFWGPRGIAVDSEGRVLVTDTGNHRVVVFDADGNFITQFGGEGFQDGYFAEPVGIAVNAEGIVYVVDTWNQRIQAFIPMPGGNYVFSHSWGVYGWIGASLDNKPYIAVDSRGHVFVTDPEKYRVIEFTPQGEYVRYWGEYSEEADGFGLSAGITVDPLGGIWVSDPINNRLLHFTLP